MRSGGLNFYAVTVHQDATDGVVQRVALFIFGIGDLLLRMSAGLTSLRWKLNGKKGTPLWCSPVLASPGDASTDLLRQLLKKLTFASRTRHHAAPHADCLLLPR